MSLSSFSLSLSLSLPLSPSLVSVCIQPPFFPAFVRVGFSIYQHSRIYFYSMYRVYFVPRIMSFAPFQSPARNLIIFQLTYTFVCVSSVCCVYARTRVYIYSIYIYIKFIYIYIYIYIYLNSPRLLCSLTYGVVERND